MKVIKGSQILAGLGWLFCFFMALAILGKKLPLDNSTIFSFVFFFIVAFFASFTKDTSKPKIKDSNMMRVKIAGQIFTGDSLTILELKSGDLFVEVDLSEPKKGVGQDGDIQTTKHPQKVIDHPVKMKRG